MVGLLAVHEGLVVHRVLGQVREDPPRRASGDPASRDERMKQKIVQDRRTMLTWHDSSHWSLVGRVHSRKGPIESAGDEQYERGWANETQDANDAA